MLGIGSGWITNSGYISGSGTIRAHVYNNGQVRPGSANSVGLLEMPINNINFYCYTDVLPETRGTIQIKLAGLEQYDKIYINGTFYAGGTLEVKFINNFMAANGGTFKIFDFAGANGVFDDIILPGDTNFWNLSKLYTDGEIIYIRPPGTILSIH